MKTRMQSIAAWILAGCCLLATGRLPALERLEPVEGCYFGISLGEGDTLARVASRLGVTPAVTVQFFGFPLGPASRAALDDFLAQVRDVQGIALVTLEPFEGLSRVTDADCLDLARLCAAHEARGIGGILVRFAHEMNGNWYPWCQQPVLYREKFRRVARAIHAGTARTAMLWAPNNGVGYPFGTSGAHQAAPGSPDFAALDTDGDGRLTAADDMYEPYYPGDDVVDWVGMTIYHWGTSFPWLGNEMPPADAFVSTLRGTGRQPALPDFYARYCDGPTRRKPLAIPETAALYNTQQGAGPGELRIKQAWWRQLFSASDGVPDAANIAVQFPRLRCINWFDHYKPEAEVQGQWVDWRISADPILRGAFMDDLGRAFHGRRYFLTAQDLACASNTDCIVAEELPALLPLAGPVPLAFTVRARADCDLVVDLLDPEFRWRAGTRVPVLAGARSIALDLRLDPPLVDGRTYRWSLFLTPTGGDSTGALAWCRGPGPVARDIRPSIQLAGCPPRIAAGTPFEVKVRCTSSSARACVQVHLLDRDGAWRGGGTGWVRRGDGLLDVAVSPQPPLTPGVYRLEGLLADSPTRRGGVMARAEGRQVWVVEGPVGDSIEALPFPAILPAGEVVRAVVSYSAAAERDLHVDLLDARTNFVAGTVRRVGPGSGFEGMSLGAPGVVPGGYLLSSFLTVPGQAWTEALAWGVARSVTVVSRGYLDWVESCWGVVLASDLILPEQDADGDGSANAAERVAGTSPLDAADVLRLEATIEDGATVLSWRSAVGGQYQLLESDSLSPAIWAPVGDVLAGSGGTLRRSLDPGLAGSGRFYRLEVWR